MSFTGIDLFAGIGGFRIAIERCGGRCINFSEIDADAIQTYLANHPESKDSNLGDITKVRNLPPHDLLTGGVPCQSWSIAGKNLGFDDDRGQLWNDAIYLLNKSRPKAFIFENVKGLVDPRNKNALEYILARIKAAGYSANFYVLNSFDYGVPQGRVRIYIIGFHEERFNRLFKIPRAVQKRVYLADILDMSESVTAPVQEEGRLVDLFGEPIKRLKGTTSLSANNNGFNDYFLFNDLRNGNTTIHSWDVLSTTQKQKQICLLLLQNRRKKKYGPLDGNPLSLKQFQSLDCKIRQSDLEDLAAIGILKEEQYCFSVNNASAQELTTEEQAILAMATDGVLIPDLFSGDRGLKVKRIKILSVLEALRQKKIIECTEVRYDFRYTKISTGLFGINRIFLPSANIFSTLVASDSNDYVTTVSVIAETEEAYRKAFIEQIYRAKKYRRITCGEACRIQGFPSSFVLPESRSRWMKLIGNSVSVPVVEKLVRAICDTGVFEDSMRVVTSEEKCMGKDLPSQPMASDGEVPFQQTLFEPRGLYVVGRSPVTLLGTYRKACREWILEKQLYNYPVEEDELNHHYELLAVRRLILVRQSDEPLYFSVEGYSFVTKQGLKKLGYAVNPRHSSEMKYILYRTKILKEAIPLVSKVESYIVGKGART